MVALRIISEAVYGSVKISSLDHKRISANSSPHPASPRPAKSYFLQLLQLLGDGSLGLCRALGAEKLREWASLGRTTELHALEFAAGLAPVHAPGPAVR